MSRTAASSSQFDLFGGGDDVPSPSLEKAPPRLPARGLSHEEMVRLLTETGRYRVLRKLEPRRIEPVDVSAYPLCGVILDTETTGLNHRKDEIIEIGIVAFAFDEKGRIGGVTGVYGGLREPSIPIPAEVTRITGITDDMVRGERIDLEAVARLIEPADLVIAHNAGFDRPFCEAFSKHFRPKAWACSVKEVDWGARGYEGTKLGYLIGQSGFFHDGHRAVDDCFALLEVLEHGTGSPSPFAELHSASQRANVRIFAENSPFDMKDHLKARGYRWSDGSEGKPKCWWVELPEEALQDELSYLGTEIYRWRDADPPVRRLTAHDRYRA